MTDRASVRGGMAIAILSSAAFALAGPMAKSLLDTGWSPLGAVLMRIGGAALLLAVPLALTLRATGLGVLRTHGRLILAYGAIPIAGAQIGFFSAVQTLPVGVALLLEYLAPVMVVGWLWATRGQRPGLVTAGGGLVAMIGLVLVLDLSGDTGLDPVGVAWALGAALCLTTYFILSARQHDDLSPILMIGSGLVVGTFVVLAASVLVSLPVEFATSDAVLSGRAVPWWVPALVLALVCSVVSYLTGLLAVQRLGSRLASFVALIEVVFTVILAWLLLAQLPSPRQLVGGALIIGGVVLVRWGEPSAPPASPAGEGAG